MQMVKKSFIIFMVAWLAILLLMPKQALYFKIEEELAKQEIVLNEKKMREGFFSLTLEEVSVYVKGIHVATIQEADLFTLLFYSSLELQSLHVDDSLRSMVPQETTKAFFSHFIFAPLKVSVKANGSFGAMAGMIDLGGRNVRLDFNESKNIEMLKPQLKKEEKGWVYETSF